MTSRQRSIIPALAVLALSSLLVVCEGRSCAPARPSSTGPVHAQTEPSWGSDSNGPMLAEERFLHALKVGNLREAYQVMCPAYKRTRNLEQFTAVIRTYPYLESGIQDYTYGQQFQTITTSDGELGFDLYSNTRCVHSFGIEGVPVVGVGYPPVVHSEAQGPPTKSL